MTSFSDTIDYTKKQFMHSSYRWMKLTPVGGSGQTVTLNNSSSTIVNFEIPNNVINLSLSKLYYDLLIGASATANKTHCVDALALSLLDRITLSTRSGVVLANCDNMGQFSHIISKLKTKVSNLIDNPSTATSLLKVYGTGAVPVVAAIYPQVSVDNTIINSSRLKPYTDICKSNGCPPNFNCRSMNVSGATIGPSVTTQISGNCLRLDGSLVSTPFLEPLHYISQNTSDTTSAALAVSYQIPLSSVKDTLLEVNKSLYFGDNLILSLSFNPARKFSFLGVATADSVGGTVAATPTIVMATQGLQTSVTATEQNATSIELKNVSLYVAVETDPIITSQLINKVNSEGFSMTVPYVYSTKTPIPLTAVTGNVIFNTTSFSMQQRITRGYGQRLLRCYSSIFGNEGTIAAGNQCGINGAAAFLPRTVTGEATQQGVITAGFTINQHPDTPLAAYNTSLDGIRLQDFTLSAEDSTHWLVNEQYLRGSCILNIDQYKNQCMHIDSWTGNSVCEEDDTIDNGLSLDADKTYGVSYNTINNITNTTSFQHYLFFVVQRVLTIKGSQIQLM